MEREKQSDMSGKIRIKIYGERNTGTNYLTTLLERNVDADLLPGRVDDTDLRTVVTRRLRQFMPGLAHAWHEAARDRFFEATFSKNLGWKHMNPDPARIGAEALNDVRFVMLVKSPYAWLLSLYQRPYHVGVRENRFEDFLEQPLTVMEQRENTGSRPLTPTEVWNHKMQGYKILQKAARHAVIVRYEDFLVDEQGALAKLAQDLGVERSGAYVPVDTGVKEQDHAISHADYVDYYLRERWRKKLSKGAVERINATLDLDLVRELGYTLVSSESAGIETPV